MKQKKGVAPVLNEILYIIVAGFVIYAIVSAGQKIGQQSTQALDWASTQNLYQLSRIVGKFAESQNKYDYTSQPFSLSEKFVIVGFSSTDKYLYSDCYTKRRFMSAEKITKPKQCGSNSCLCMWEDTDRYDFDEDEENTVHSCYVLPDIDYIVSYYCGFGDDECKTGDKESLWQNLKGSKKGVDYSEAVSYAEGIWKGNYAPFIVYGECEHYWSATELHTIDLYVEKVQQNGKNTLFMFADKLEHIEERKKILSDKFAGQAKVDVRKLEDSIREGNQEVSLRLLADLSKNEEGKKLLLNEIIKVSELISENKKWFEDGTDYGNYYLSLLEKRNLIKYFLDNLDESSAKQTKIRNDLERIHLDIENIFIDRIDRLIDRSSTGSPVVAVNTLYSQREQNVTMKGVLLDKVRYITQKLMEKREVVKVNKLFSNAIEYMKIGYPPATTETIQIQEEVDFLGALLDEENPS